MRKYPDAFDVLGLVKVLYFFAVRFPRRAEIGPGWQALLYRLFQKCILAIGAPRVSVRETVEPQRVADIELNLVFHLPPLRKTWQAGTPPREHYRHAARSAMASPLT